MFFTRSLLSCLTEQWLRWPQQGGGAQRACPRIVLQPARRAARPWFENQSYRASGLNLLVAAIILWTTRYLERALTDMGTTDEVVRHIVPLGWEHIALTGDHSWERDDRPAPDQLKPLRISPSFLAA